LEEGTEEEQQKQEGKAFPLLRFFHQVAGNMAKG
jgi:hypothetical protein